MTKENKEKTKKSYLDICYKSFVIAGMSVFMVTKSFEYYEKGIKKVFNEEEFLLNIDHNLYLLTKDQIGFNALNYAAKIKDEGSAGYITKNADHRLKNVNSVLRKKTKELVEVLLKEEQMKNGKDSH